ncbi:MAG: ribosomal protein L13e [Candidatus Bathyarchaeia archaeon]
MIKAIVYRGMRRRAGKGFSKEELKAVNLSFKEALKLGLPINARRRTVHKENIESLKNYLTQLYKEGLKESR